MYLSPCKQVTMEIEPMWTAAFLLTAVDFGPARKCDMALMPFAGEKKEKAKEKPPQKNPNNLFQMLHLSISLQHYQVKAKNCLKALNYLKNRQDEWEAKLYQFHFSKLNNVLSEKKKRGHCPSCYQDESAKTDCSFK